MTFYDVCDKKGPFSVSNKGITFRSRETQKSSGIHTNTPLSSTDISVEEPEPQPRPLTHLLLSVSTTSVYLVTDETQFHIKVIGNSEVNYYK